LRGLEQALGPVRRRVRWVTAWRGAALGLIVGSLAAVAWVALDWMRLADADWVGLAAVAAAGTAVGALAGGLRRLPMAALARSVDIRARLQDRTASAASGGSGEFADALAADATGRLADVRPRDLYPIRFGRLQSAGLATAVLAGALFALGNSPVVRGPKSPQERAELKKAGATVQRVAKPLADRPKKGKLADGDRKLATDLQRLGKELESGKVTKQEALRAANKLAEQAERQAQGHAKEAAREIAKADTALKALQEAQLDRAGAQLEGFRDLQLSEEQREFIERERVEQGWKNGRSAQENQSLDQMGLSESARQLAQLSPEQREALRKAVSERQAELQERLRQAEGMSAEQRQAAERELQEMKDLMESLKLSEEALKSLQELMASPEAQRLRELLQKMQQSAQQQAQGQTQDPEEARELMRQAQQLAEQLKDPAVREAVRQALRRAAEELESGKLSAEAAAQMMAALGMSPGAGSQDQFADTGKVVQSDKEMKTAGKTIKTGVRGQWSEKGDEYSVEIKAPTRLGSKSTVPYRKVLPSYKRAAESAIERNAVPREHERRVKEYFESLGKG
jgi:hypothetical protein